MSRGVWFATAGLVDVLRSPWLVVAAFVVTLGAALPFAVVVGNQLQDALAHQPPIALGSGEIDADWWSEFRAHAEGLAATFTPAVIGFAAPLDNLSALLDGARRPAALIAPLFIAMVGWAWLWGVALARLGAGATVGRALKAGVSHWPRFLLISVAAALVQLLLYLTIHPLLFSVIYTRAAPSSEPAAFAVRVMLYLIFGALVVTVSLVADYTRIVDVLERPNRIADLARAGVQFVAANLRRALGLYIVTGVLFVVLLAGYGVIEIYGGSRVGGWRGVALAQVYFVGRLIIRLTFAAGEIRLFRDVRFYSSR